ncbi:tetratricopeptide repeat-containing sensor histidine kinase [Runella salmonicolor]|uniref:Oxygen sensor histidine kinase NreB n=1 Tax=Runella salmonicolor TaxID=2950278 RepID=A0ABT1FUY7_9BACT|nr:sensor histidine kinase [Runella salmonicolor]MCP1384302.1 sensor histidine kinase [Runella salmonicolor]
MKKTVCFLLLFPFSLGFMQAQNPLLDSLIHHINDLSTKKASIQRDTNIILSLSLLTERSLNMGDSRNQFFLDSLQRFTKKTNWPKGLGLHERALGKQNDVKGNYTEALKHYTNAIQLLKKAGGDSFELAYAYVLAAFVLNNNGLTDKCLEMLNEALPYAKATKNKNNLCWIYDFLGDYNYYDSFGVRNYKKALFYYKEVEKNIPYTTSPTLKADNPHCLANVYMKLGDEKKANDYRDNALRIAKQYNNRVVIFATYADLADIYEQQKSYEKALEYRKASLEYAQKSGWKEMESRAENYIYQTYKHIGDYKNALKYYELHKTHEDSLGRFSVQKAYAELQTKYEAEKQRLRITDLEKEQLIQTRNFLIGLSVLGVLLTGFIFWSNRKLKAKNQQLKTKNREIEEALLKGQTIERKRVASELHDNLNTKIAALRWRLEALDTSKYPEADQKIHAGLLQTLEDVYADVRLISHNLLPTELETQGLVAALQKLTEKLNGNAKTVFHLVANGITERLNPKIEYQLYSVALELVNNVLKHAQAQQVWISISQNDEIISLTVSDDGRGMSNIEKATGVGLRNISARVEALNGTWLIDSKPTTGTKVTIEVPV